MKTLAKPKENIVEKSKETITEKPKEKLIISKENIKNKPKEDLSKKQSNFNEDVPIILQSRDPNKEDHPAFYISLIAKNKLLHNCMLDSGASSNIMTKKVMEQMGNRMYAPWIQGKSMLWV